MRLIGHLAEEMPARTFGDFLYVRGIDNNIEADAPAGWGVWIHDEDKLQEAASLLAEFRAAPDKPEYRERAAEASSRRRAKEKSDEAYRKRFHDKSDVFRSVGGYALGRVTIALIAISAIVFLFTYIGQSTRVIGWIIITQYVNVGLDEIRHGQLWRLVTPIFWHRDFLHILFNMLWLLDLGGMIESRLGSRFLLIFVVLVAAGSNLAQYYDNGPLFGGMSGVVYGLLGYVWIRGKFDPMSGLFLHPTTVTMMLVWAVICLVGIIPNVANTAHFVGLGLGGVWAYFASLRAHRR